MQKPFFISSLIATLAAGFSASAQTPVSTTTPTFIDIGNIRAPHYPVGDMWWSPQRASFAGLEFPKGDTNQVRGFGGVLFGGRDASNALVVAGNVYRQSGTDFQPGPIITSDSASQARSAAAWTKIWKVNSSDIDVFLANRANGIPGIPQSIVEWPGKGNPFAKGGGGASLTLDRDFAPFVDANQDGVYNPYDGDFPRMKGSQMLWWMFNDRKSHPLSRTFPVEAEVSVSAYAYANGTIANNVIFYEYELLNRGASLSDFHFGSFSDFDITDAFSDFLGIDSAKRLAIMYNGSLDSVGARGNPAAGFMLMEQPGDSYAARSPLRNINYVNTTVMTTNGSAIYAELSNPQSLYRPWTAGLDWECNDPGKQPGDRLFVLSSGAIPFPSNSRARFAFALIMADSAMACPRMTFAGSLATADTAYERYWHPSRQTPASNPTKVGGHVTGVLSVYPNPVENVLHVNASLQHPAVQVTNTVGAVVNVPVQSTSNGVELNTGALAPGIYYLQLRSAIDGSSSSTRFTKL